MKLFKLLVASLMFCSAAGANDVFLRYNVNAVKPYPDLKGLTVGYTRTGKVFAYKFEAGFLSDLRVPNWTLLGQAGIGVEPTFGPVYISFFQSIGAVSREDRFLSGYFQFFEDLSVGFRGTNGTAIGFSYKHISNAGIKSPNKGKDLIGLQIRIPVQF